MQTEDRFFWSPGRSEHIMTELTAREPDQLSTRRIDMADSKVEQRERSLSIRMKGADNESLRSDLRRLGFSIAVDGKFGKITKSAFFEFQKRHNIEPTSMVDEQTAVISPKMPMKEILQFRHENEKCLKKVRGELVRLARKIRQDPLSKEFAEELDVDVIPRIQCIMEDNKKTSDSWFKTGRGKKALKLAGLMAGAASATISLALSATLLLPVAVVTGVLGLLGGSVTPGAVLALDWKYGRHEATNCTIY